MYQLTELPIFLSIPSLLFIRLSLNAAYINSSLCDVIIDSRYRQQHRTYISSQSDSEHCRTYYINTSSYKISDNCSDNLLGYPSHHPSQEERARTLKLQTVTEVERAKPLRTGEIMTKFLLEF